MPIVHITRGLLDIRAFTILGLHAKPKTDTPIGKFGSGLKYAVATLVRLGCRVQVFIGTTEYEFYTKQSDFRGAEFKQLMMRKREGHALEMDLCRAAVHDRVREVLESLAGISRT